MSLGLWVLVWRWLGRSGLGGNLGILAATTMAGNGKIGSFFQGE